MTADLSALIARLEAAEAGGRELGHEVLMALGWRRSVVGHFYGPLYQWASPDFSPHLISGDEDKLPNPVLSLDAALALAERIGWRVYSIDMSIIGRASVMLQSLDDRPGTDPETGAYVIGKDFSPGSARLPALALCIATLRAKLDGYEAEGEVNKNPKAQEG